MALSIGILSRSILNGTHTVLLQHSHRSKDNPRPQAGRWRGCRPSPHYRVYPDPQNKLRQADALFPSCLHCWLRGAECKHMLARFQF